MASGKWQAREIFVRRNHRSLSIQTAFHPKREVAALSASPDATEAGRYFRPACRPGITPRLRGTTLSPTSTRLDRARVAADGSTAKALRHDGADGSNALERPQGPGHRTARAADVDAPARGQDRSGGRPARSRRDRSNRRRFAQRGHNSPHGIPDCRDR